MARAAAIDLGTTKIKAACWIDGRLEGVVARDAPALEGEGLARTCSADAYLAVARSCLGAVLADAPRDIPVGISSQRSSFLLWEASTGKALTPLISWQDRSAHAWCEAHRAREAFVRGRTGLPLSPHYAGPKLAVLMAGRPSLRGDMAAGRVRFGTLDTRFLGPPYETDGTMAARTLMADPRTGTWDDELLALFGVPRAALPDIVPTARSGTRLDDGGVVRATMADQAAAVHAVLGDSEDAALVNLGTGGFVLRVTGNEMSARPGYLTGPALWRGDAPATYTVEGTINGIGAALERFGDAPIRFPDRDPVGDAFCLPDTTGVGSPHWRAEIGLRMSSAAGALPPRGRRRIVLEGIAFRVREILEDLFSGEGPARVYLSGGLARDPSVAPALADTLGRAVLQLEETEATLHGVGCLAAGAVPGAHATQTQRPGAAPWLATKYEAWRRWVEEELG